MAAGKWEPMLLGIEPRTCPICRRGLYRNVTLFKGGWARCTRCNEFVHYSCLASGKSGFLKARPRVCLACRSEAGMTSPEDTSSQAPAVGL